MNERIDTIAFRSVCAALRYGMLSIVNRTSTEKNRTGQNCSRVEDDGPGGGYYCFVLVLYSTVLTDSACNCEMKDMKDEIFAFSLN